MSTSDNAKAIFQRIFELTPEQRAAYLDEHCPDPLLRAEVESLLAAHDSGAELPTVRQRDRPDPAAPTVIIEGGRIGEFEILRELGHGAMGVVYLARDTTLGRDVALKVLPRGRSVEQAVSRFRNEARAVAQLNHRSIVPIYSVGEEDGQHYIAMEYVEGVTLRSRLTEARRTLGGDDGSSTHRKRVDWHRTVAELTARVADGLEHAHQHGIIHRDVKPANIMVSTADEPRLTDFGIAKILSDDTLTTTGGPPGTYRYMSPEQARASRIGLDHRTDVFSLGVVLYESLTFTVPFDGESPPDIMNAICSRQPARLRTLDGSIHRDLETICTKALEKDPAHRFQSAGHFAAELRSYLAGRPLIIKPPSVARRVRYWARQHRTQSLAAMVVLLLGVIALLAWAGVQGARQRRCPVTVVSATPGAVVYARRVDDRTLEPEPARELGTTPLTGVRLAPGLYRFVVTRPGGEFAEATAYLDDPSTTIELDVRLGRPGSPRTDDMVRFEAGSYAFGREDGEVYEQARMVSLQAFWIDRYEVTNAQYRAFVEATGRPYPAHWQQFEYAEALADRPVVAVTWSDAQAYARWVGKRLPTVFEWECAARAPDGRRLPWSDATPELPEITTDMITKLMSAEWEIGYGEYVAHARPAAGDAALATPRGLHHLAGNVAEWTDSTVLDRGAGVLAKGATWIDPPDEWDLTRNGIRPRGGKSLATGFRCALSAAPPVDTKEQRP